MAVARESELRSFHALEQQCIRSNQLLLDIIRRPANVIPFLNPGRLFYVRRLLQDS